MSPYVRAVAVGLLLYGAVLGYPLIWIVAAQYQTATQRAQARAQMVDDALDYSRVLQRMMDADDKIEMRLNAVESTVARNSARLEAQERLTGDHAQIEMQVAVIKDEVAKAYEFTSGVLILVLGGIALALWQRTQFSRRIDELHRKHGHHSREDEDSDDEE